MLLKCWYDRKSVQKMPWNYGIMQLMGTRKYQGGKEQNRFPPTKFERKKKNLETLPIWWKKLNGANKALQGIWKWNHFSDTLWTEHCMYTPCENNKQYKCTFTSRYAHTHKYKPASLISHLIHQCTVLFQGGEPLVCKSGWLGSGGGAVGKGEGEEEAWRPKVWCQQCSHTQ